MKELFLEFSIFDLICYYDKTQKYLPIYGLEGVMGSSKHHVKRADIIT